MNQDWAPGWLFREIIADRQPIHGGSGQATLARSIVRTKLKLHQPKTWRTFSERIEREGVKNQ